MHVLLSPASVYPVLQLHSRDPCVLIHICKQPPLLVLHSLISIEEINHIQLISNLLLCVTYEPGSMQIISKFFQPRAKSERVAKTCVGLKVYQHSQIKYL